MKIVLEPKRFGTLKEMLDKIANVGEKLATELKWANDLKEKES